MAKAFGKFKRLIKKPGIPKAGKGHHADDRSSPTSTPTRDTEVLKPPDTEVLKSATASQDGLTGPESVKNALTTATPKHSNGSKNVVIATDADDVLDGILQDLNIKGGQLDVSAGKTDTVSEYSGGSAKSVESSSSEEDDEETDDDGDETETDEEEEAGKKKKSSVGDRVAAVVAAAEEIRKKRNSPTTNPDSRSSSPKTEPGSAATPTPPADGDVPVTMKKSRDGSRSGKLSMQESKQDTVESSRAPSKQSSKKSRSKKSLRNSPITAMLPKPKKRSTTPQFSPETQQNNNDEEAEPEFPTATGLKSFESKDNGDDNHTKDTQEVSEEGTYGEGTYGDEEDNTIGESTLGMSYDAGTRPRGSNDRDANASLSDSQTFDDEDGTLEDDRMKANRTVMNKDIIIHEPGQPSNLVVRAMYYTPLPASPEDIIIKVEASTVSYRDCLIRRGIGMDKITFPFVPGCEVVGTISNVGKAARNEGYRIGDRVVGMSRRGGGNGYYAKFNTNNVAPVISANIDPADLACLTDVYMTAYQALRVGKKDGTPLTEANVLITDGFSPVGQAAVALAKLEGANVYVTTIESRQDEYMKTLGVKCLPLAPNKWLHKLKGKMDIVIDNTCFDSYDSSWKALNVNGVLVCTGMTSLYSFQDFTGGGCGGCEAFGDMRDYQAKWAAIKAKYMMSQTKFHDLRGSFEKDPKKYQQELKYLCFLVESGQLKPKIAERVSIEEVPDAQRYLETGKANGTIVCLP